MSAQSRHMRGLVTRLMLAAVMTVACFGFAEAQRRTDELHTPRYYAGRAENYQQAESWEASKREIDEGLKLYPDNADLRYLNGKYYYYAEGDLMQARYNLIKSLQEDDNNYGAKRLMVDVEDDSEHYSSAICYINELLEYQPYDRDLWRRKIALYRKIGHETEADNALTRLARIYPNDSIVRQDLSNHNRENWTSRLSHTSLQETINTLEAWLEIDPGNLEYYEELTDAYHHFGELERAIGAANRGLSHFPRNQALVYKAAHIMTEMGFYTLALDFLQQNGYTGQMYDDVLYDASRDARMKDPYEANGRLYARTGDREALAYLLNTAITRGYYDDARMYLAESYKIYGRTAQLLMKDYTLEKRFGHDYAAMAILEELCKVEPDDADLSEEYAVMMLELAGRDISNEQWGDAAERLEKALKSMSPDNEAWPSAVARYITVLGHMNRLAEARKVYFDAVSVRRDEQERFASAYEDLAANRLRMLVQEERYSEALKEAEDLLTVVPNSEAGLRCCINMAQTLEYEKLFYEYADKGYEAYPESPYFIIKEAVALQQRGREAEAIALLHPYSTDDEYVNPQLMAAFSGITAEWAILLIKENMPDIAMEKIDAALVYDPNNTELLYLKGLAYEKMKMYREAYEYQSTSYNPSNAEQRDWYQHMRWLRYRGYKNRVDASYTRATYNFHDDEKESSTVAHLYSLATVSYSRVEDNNTYSGQISYKGVDGVLAADRNQGGGIGLEFMTQWDHTFNHRWSGYVNASYGTRYFNKWGANVSASYAFDLGWTPSLRLGYRRTPPTAVYPASGYGTGAMTKYNLFLITPSVSKSWERIFAALSTDFVVMGKYFYYNATLKGKLFVNEDNVSSVALMTGFGSFPELTFFEQSLLSSLSRLNAMVGFDAQYLITHNLCVGLTGSWNTCFNPQQQATGGYVDSYRNIFVINLQAHLAF